MKEWAKSFYLSSNWIETRNAYMTAQHYMCERCQGAARICHHKTWLTRQNINDPYTALSWDNLEALCQDCHNREHHKKSEGLRYKFSEDGKIIRNPPCPEK